MQHQVTMLRNLRIKAAKHSSLSPLTIKSVLRCIDDSATEGVCCRSYASIANELQIARKTVMAAMRELKEFGLVEVERSWGKPQPLKIKINWGRVQEMGEGVSERSEK